MIPMPHKLLTQAAELPKEAATWHVTVRRAPAWITPKNKPPYRPFLILVLNATSDRIRGSQTVETQPHLDVVLKTLADAMLHPMPGGGKRGRPGRILLDNADLVNQLAPHLAEIEVRCEYHSGSAMITNALRELTAHMNPDSPQASLMGVRGITIPLMAEFYTAAAEFYAQAPWRWLDNLMPIELHYPADGPAQYTVLMGHGGESFGLAFYRSLAELSQQFTLRDSEEAFRKMTALSVTYDEPTFLAFEDLDAIDAHGWPVAGPKGYPLMMKVTPRAGLIAATLDEVIMAAAALRVVPGFVTGNLQADRGIALAADATLPLAGVYAGRQIRLSYPTDFPDVWALPGRKLDYKELDEMIAHWHSDERSRLFARHLGAFLLAFLDSQAAVRASGETLRRYESNCWLIGRLICESGAYQTFSPQIFLGKPAHAVEFRQKVSNSPQAWASYEATWRKLTDFARAMGYSKK
jgi:hypothetical protein